MHVKFVITNYRYWIDQIGALADKNGTKPIIVVGTHADCISKKEREAVLKDMEQQFPVHSNQIHGHFAIGLTSSKTKGLTSLQAKLIDIAQSHPKIGVGRVQVPHKFVILQELLKADESPYIQWRSYVKLGESKGM